MPKKHYQKKNQKSFLKAVANKKKIKLDLKKKKITNLNVKILCVWVFTMAFACKAKPWS